MIDGRHVKIVDQLYVMYEVRSDRLWCNGTPNCDKRPPFSENDVAHISWIPNLHLPSKQYGRSWCQAGAKIPRHTMTNHDVSHHESASFADASSCLAS